MISTAKRLHRTCLVIAFVLFPGAMLSAQQTLQVRADPESRALYRQAESMLASGDSQGAYELLSPRYESPSGNSYFDYLLGVAALDSGRIDEAIMSLRRAVDAAPLFSGARMELARALFEAGNAAAARPLFTQLLGESPPPTVRDVIERYINAIDTRFPRAQSRFAPYAELIAGHDSNANGSTDDQQFLGFTLSPENLESDSTFYDAAAGFNWTVPRGARLAWQLGARGGFRKNPDASFVDSALFSTFAGLRWQSGAAFGNAGIDGYWSSRDGESNESYSGANLMLGRHINDSWDLAVTVRGGAVRYDDDIEVLDVNRTLYSVSAARRFGSRSSFRVEAIGGSDKKQQSGSPYGNSKTGGRVSLNTAIADNAYLFASVGSLTSDFDGLFFGLPREDTQLTSLLQLEFRNVPGNGFSLLPQLRYVDNDSDVGLYDYDRLEVGLMIRWVAQ